MNQLSNKEIANLLETTADLLELAGENSFKIKSYSIAAFRINKLPRPLHEMTDREIRKIENIGPSMVSKLEELLRTGTFQELDSLLKETPSGILELLTIKGLGAKKIRQLWLELEIESIGELAYACQENRLTSLKGFGKKTQENILNNIQFIQANKDKFLLYQVRNFAIELLEELLSYFGDHQIELVGDVARNNNIVSSIEYVGDWQIEEIETFIKQKWNEELIHGENDIQIKLENIPFIRFYSFQKEELLYQTFKQNSSEEFMRYVEESNLDFTTINNDTEIFNKLGLTYFPPPMREIENIKFVELMEGGINPIQLSQIRGLIHCHSNWSDGLHSIEQMAQACIQRGWEYMVLTDHSVSAFYANGLTKERIIEQHKEIDLLNEKLAPFKIFKGIEADILYSGDIDYDEDVWKLFDVIIASVHSNLRMTPEKANERILKALENPYVKLLGHPTGRLLLSRDGYGLDHELIIDKCAEKGIAIEINAHPRRLDLDWRYVNYAIKKGVKLSINPDAHSIDGIDLLEYGVLASHKTFMSPIHNLSSYTLEQIEDWIKQ